MALQTINLGNRRVLKWSTSAHLLHLPSKDIPVCPSVMAQQHNVHICQQMCHPALKTSGTLVTPATTTAHLYWLDAAISSTVASALCTYKPNRMYTSSNKGRLPPPWANTGQVLVQGVKVWKHGVAVFGQACVCVRHVPRNTCCRPKPTLPLKTRQHKAFIFMCTAQVPLSCLYSD